MSTYGSIAFLDNNNGYVIAVNGPDMMYSGRGKEICQLLNSVLDLSNSMQKCLKSVAMYVNYLRAKRHERSLKEMFPQYKDFLDAQGFNGIYHEFNLSEIKKVNPIQTAIINGDGSEWTYIKNITQEQVNLYVYGEHNYKQPKYVYELKPMGVCCLHWGCMPRGTNMYNKNLKLIKTLY